MHAIMYDKETRQILGYFPNYTLDVELYRDYVLVDELPPEAYSLPVNTIAILREDGSIEKVAVTPPEQPKNIEQLRIEQLEAELAATNTNMAGFMDYVMNNYTPNTGG